MKLLENRKQNKNKMVTETHLNQIYEHFGLTDYDVIQMVSREVWKNIYGGVMNELLDKTRTKRITASMGDQRYFWKPEIEVINYGLGSIFINESKEQMITR
ncbi:MAG TPA: hypothetical protein VMX17_04980, partial [Candidatus Glassbacteria bacterium]|nr:hypothetical protein [Candidatus Glassbacteria bacterium]